MQDAAAFTIQAFDNNTQIFSYSVPFSWRITAHLILDQAFTLNQTTSKADPFFYTLEYYGYSQSAQYPGYLGYEIESINKFVSDGSSYWSLSVNGVPSPTGLDTTYPNPGATVKLTYQAVGSAPADHANPRQAAIQTLREARQRQRGA